ncbi:hypothetical protein ACFFJN_20030 [Erwinia mallotivora]
MTLNVTSVSPDVSINVAGYRTLATLQPWRLSNCSREGVLG